MERRNLGADDALRGASDLCPGIVNIPIWGARTLARRRDDVNSEQILVRQLWVWYGDDID
jgi:hypothetical protein